MFNSGYKEEAIRDLKNTNEKYKNVVNSTKNRISTLFNEKKKSFNLIKDVEGYVNTIANKPKEFISKIEEMSFNRKSFKKEVMRIEEEYKNTNIKSGATAGAGVAAGVGVAAFAPTAAMAVATTFGTASTGTAIASLSGAAATNAAMAWLGGGALVAGGGGMAAGEALLALAGPIGWAIGGTALVGGALFASSKNKKAAEEAEEARYKIMNEMQKYKKVRTEVNGLTEQLNKLEELINYELYNLKYQGITNYINASIVQKDMLGRLVNEANILSKKINEKLKTEL